MKNTRMHPWAYDFTEIMREVIKHPKAEHEAMLMRAFDWLKAPYNIHAAMYGVDPKYCFGGRNRTLDLLEGAYAYASNVK